MSVQSRLTSKLATLEAARAIYFIVVGLAIKQSLVIFSHSWHQAFPESEINWWGWDERILIGAGYLITALRFSHGVSLLHGHERNRVEKTTLPSSWRIFWLAVFMVLLSIFFFLMADNLVPFNTYVRYTAITLTVDLIYILTSGVIRNPLSRLFRLTKETVQGYPAKAALQWMVSDLVLLGFCFLLTYPSFSFNQTPHERLFGGILISAALVDYLWNRALYFGGINDRRMKKFVFVCSPLSGDLLGNINRAQLYCYRLMKYDGGDFKKNLIPFASHCFFPYFLNDDDAGDRIIGRECAHAFLAACDAIFVYVPSTNRRWHFLEKVVGKVPRKDELSPGMIDEVGEAKKMGLEIQYKERVGTFPIDWKRPAWSPLVYAPVTSGAEVAATAEGNPVIYFDNTELRKRVYVCTPLRGTGFNGLPATEKKGRIQRNMRAALWHCHELARDEKERIAPFAPQAFFPYFWNFFDGDNIDSEKWDAWFDRSIDVLKVCDAVYIYTSDGLPPNPRNISDGMQKIQTIAENLGIEIKYRKELVVPSDEVWQPALPDFD